MPLFTRVRHLARLACAAAAPDRASRLALTRSPRALCGGPAGRHGGSQRSLPSSTSRGSARRTGRWRRGADGGRSARRAGLHATSGRRMPVCARARQRTRPLLCVRAAAPPEPLASLPRARRAWATSSAKLAPAALNLACGREQRSPPRHAALNQAHLPPLGCCEGNAAGAARQAVGGRRRAAAVRRAPAGRTATARCAQALASPCAAAARSRLPRSQSGLQQPGPGGGSPSSRRRGSGCADGGCVVLERARARRGAEAEPARGRRARGRHAQRNRRAAARGLRGWAVASRAAPPPLRAARPPARWPLASSRAASALVGGWAGLALTERVVGSSPRLS